MKLSIDAIRLLRDKGRTLHMVMTGMPVDGRDRNNETLSRYCKKSRMRG